MMNKGLLITILAAAVIVGGSLVYVGVNSCDNEISTDDIKAAVIDGLNEFVQVGPGAGETGENGDDSAGEYPTLSSSPSLDGPSLDDPVNGEKNAAITIYEFSEFQCPYCKKYYDDTYNLIKENFIDTGIANYVFINFPLDFHDGAYPAALVGECVLEQGGDSMFYAFHDKVFDDNSILNGSASSIYEGLISLGEDVGADVDELEECVFENRYESEVARDINEGRSNGVSGTPSFVINGELIVGAQPYSVFEEIIEKALAQ